MSSKRFRGKNCYYCGSNKSTSTGDHVFARNFFLVRHRQHLPKVPCCKKCNDAKSQLEHYLLSVLPFGGNHPGASENLTSNIPRRLQRNSRLARDLYSGLSRKHKKTSAGLLVPTMTLPLDSARLTQLFSLITTALVQMHFKERLSKADIVDSSVNVNNIDSFLNGPVRSKIMENLGEGTISYTGVQALDNAKVTAWEYVVYGGLEFQEGKLTNVVSFTGPKTSRRNIEKRRNIT